MCLCEWCDCRCYRISILYRKGVTLLWRGYDYPNVIPGYVIRNICGKMRGRNTLTTISPSITSLGLPIGSPISLRVTCIAFVWL